MRGGEILAETSFLTKLTHSQIILPTLLRTLDDAAVPLSDIDVFSASAGPGSYTGLRIGLAAIKGLCAMGKRCAGVSTLEAMAFNCAQKGIIVPIMQARPGVAYFGVYQFDGENMRILHADRVGAETEIRQLVSGIESEVILTGDCAVRIKSELFPDEKNVRAALPNQRLMSACGVCMAALSHSDEWCAASELRARYLQNTMAEKLKSGE